MNVDSTKLLEEAERLITSHFIRCGPLDEDEALAILRRAIKHIALCATCGHPQDAHWEDIADCTYPTGEGVVCGCDDFEPEVIAK